MGAPYFRFKQFTVWHDRCAMKVGTDGVLLGAWAGQERLGETQVNHPRNILDIGTGSGLIALMLAQRFPQARITGIDCDKDAAMQAMENFTGSPWADRLRAVRTGLQDFCRDTATAAERFDLIVSNPPFYDNTLTNPDSRRSAARHTLRRPPLRHGGLQSDRSLRVREIHPAAGGQKQALPAPHHPGLLKAVPASPAHLGIIRQAARPISRRGHPHADRPGRTPEYGARGTYQRLLPL